MRVLAEIGTPVKVVSAVRKKFLQLMGHVKIDAPIEAILALVSCSGT